MIMYELTKVWSTSVYLSLTFSGIWNIIYPQKQSYDKNPIELKFPICITVLHQFLNTPWQVFEQWLVNNFIEWDQKFHEPAINHSQI